MQWSRIAAFLQNRDANPRQSLRFGCWNYGAALSDCFGSHLSPKSPMFSLWVRMTIWSPKKLRPLMGKRELTVRIIANDSDIVREIQIGDAQDFPWYGFAPMLYSLSL
jgi:hypothetical protein